MKSRRVRISMDLRTDIPMKWLNHKDRWQTLLDHLHDITKNPIANDYLVERVRAIRLEEK